MPVVGASATRIQIADEIHRSSRPVTIEVGEHVQAPCVDRPYLDEVKVARG